MAELHPFFVHFPIALIMVSVLFDVYGAFRDEKQHIWTAYILQLVATVSAILAAVTGNLAESAIVSQEALHQGVVEAFDKHVSWGNALVWIIVLVSLGRTFSVLEKKSWATRGWVFPLVSTGLAFLVLTTGLLGGDLSREILLYFQLN